MADTKINDLPENTTPALIDLLALVNDPTGTPATEKLTIQDLSNLILADGYVQCTKTLVYAAADDPSFTFTIADFDATTIFSAGMKLKLTNATVKYFFITKVVFDDPGSTITIYGGTDYDLVNDTISSPFYSTQKAPLDFPMDPTKWTVEVTDNSNQTQASPIITTWYNLGSLSITIPIGAWNVFYKVLGLIKKTLGSHRIWYEVTLSTASDSESDEDWTCVEEIYPEASAEIIDYLMTSTMEKPIILATKDVYYLTTRVVEPSGLTSVNFAGNQARTIFRAVCSYL